MPSNHVKRFTYTSPLMASRQYACGLILAIRDRRVGVHAPGARHAEPWARPRDARGTALGVKLPIHVGKRVDGAAATRSSTPRPPPSRNSAKSPR